MKILLISHKFHPYIGGIEVNSEILAHAFHKAGEDIKLMTWTTDPQGKRFPFPVIRNPTLSMLFKAHRWAEVVFENNPSLRLTWPAIIFNKPSVIAIRTWISRIDGKIGWQDKLKYLWLKRASAVIAVSKAVQFRCWPAATVVGNPYRLDLFKIYPKVPRNNSFVFLGRLVSDKGADLAIKAIHTLLVKKIYKYTSKHALTIIGDGPERQRLENLVLDLGLEDKVVFTGLLRDETLVTCLNNHQYLLVPSLWEEPFGNVALEGMACGCLPIVSDTGGLPDAVGNAGLTFRSGNVNSLVTCIQTLLDNPDLEEQIRKAAPNHLAAHHPAIISHRYLEIIRKAADQKN